MFEIVKQIKLQKTCHLFVSLILRRSQSTKPISDDIVELVEISEEHQRKARNETFNKAKLVSRLKEKFGITEFKAESFIQKNEIFLGQSNATITQNLDFLISKKISLAVVFDNPWLLGVSPDELKIKFKILQRLNPHDNNDYVPLIRLSTLQIMHIRSVFQKEQNEIPDGNRIYFMSRLLETEPVVVSRIVATKPTIIDFPLENFVENIKLAIQYKIPSKSILKGVSFLQKDPKETRRRLELCKDVKPKYLPTLLATSTSLFRKQSVRRRMEGNMTVVELLSLRLGYDIETTKEIAAPVNYFIDNGLSVGKVNKVLDYLMLEENFQPIEIARTIVVIVKSVETMKQRISQLKSIGVRPHNLCVLYESEKLFGDRFERLKKGKRELS